MIAMIFVGIILDHLDMLNGWMLFWYIIGMIFSIAIDIGKNDL